jgi:hypothetical protein
MKTHLRVVMLFLLATAAIYAQAPEKMDAGFCRAR